MEDNKKTGFIRLYRSVKKHPLWKKSRKKSWFEAWVDLLFSANHADVKEPVGYDMIIIKRGQVLTSQEKLGKEWGWDRGSVRSFVKMLEYENMCTCFTTSKYTMITICNYNTYNDSKPTGQHQLNINSTSTQHQVNTNKNYKELKELKEDNSAPVFSKEQEEEFRKFLDWLKKYAFRVTEMREPLSIDEFFKIKEFPKEQISEIFLAMHNYEPLLKKNISANLTFRSWAKRREGDKKAELPKPGFASAIKKARESTIQ